MRLNDFLDTSYLFDTSGRKTESASFYYLVSSSRICSDMLRIRDYKDKSRLHRFNLNRQERDVVSAERSALTLGFSQVQVSSIIYMITRIGGERLEHMLEKISAKLFVLENYFGISKTPKHSHEPIIRMMNRFNL